MFLWYLVDWLIDWFYDLGWHFCSSEFTGVTSAYIISIFKINCSLKSAIV